MASHAAPTGRINLNGATVLMLDPNAHSLALLSQILMGFGTKSFLKAASNEEAQYYVEKQPVDLIIAEGEGQLDQPDGYDFVHWLRRSKLDPNAYAPAIVMSAHTSRRNVVRARDCGANFVVAKPLIPNVLLDRILWIARENRPFVSCRVYVGPDRRFKNEGPPPGSDGRRESDLPPEVGIASTPNMSQDEIDDLMQPRRASL